MKLKNKKIVVLSVILVMLLIGWWGFYPIKQTCELYNIHHKHSIFNPYMREPNMDLVEYVLNTPRDYTIQSPLFINSQLSLKNISYRIYTKRYVHEKFDIYPDRMWISLLTKIGHYEEAESYLKKYKFEIGKNLIYFNYGCMHDTDITNRFKILACEIVEGAITLKDTKIIKYLYDYEMYYLASIIAIAKEKGPFWYRENFEFEKVPLPFCPENYDRSKFRSGLPDRFERYPGLQYCGHVAYLTYLLQENKLEQTNEYLKLYEKQYGDRADFLLYGFRYRLAMAYYEKQEYAKAIPLLKQVLKVQDYDYFANKKIAECYRKIGNIKQAQYYENIMKELLAL